MDEAQSNSSFDPIPTPISTDPRTYTSESLLQGEKVIFIRHGEETYKLVHTRSNKLILNK